MRFYIRTIDFPHHAGIVCPVAQNFNELQFNARAELAAEKARHQATREALASLRSAWNAHFDTCPTSVPDIPPPTWEQIHDWANAPSGTASGWTPDYPRGTLGEW